VLLQYHLVTHLPADQLLVQRRVQEFVPLFDLLMGRDDQDKFWKAGLRPSERITSMKYCAVISR
jgi:hypothetical protein